MNKPLKHCPFCGKTDEVELSTSSEWGETRYYVGCNQCGLMTASFETEKEAQEFWDTRGEGVEYFTDEQLRQIGIEAITAIKASIYNANGDLSMDEVRENFVLDIVNLTGEWEGFPNNHHAIKRMREFLYGQADLVGRHVAGVLEKIKEQDND